MVFYIAVNILIETFTIIAVCVVLIKNTNTTALIAPACIVLLGFMLLLIFKKLAKRIGSIRQKAESGRIQILRETYENILDIKCINLRIFSSTLY